jgi:hypothetical protein
MTQRRSSAYALAAVVSLLGLALCGCAGGGEEAGAGSSAEAPTGVAARLASHYSGGDSEAELKEFVDSETNSEERQQLREELPPAEQSELTREQAEQGAEAGAEAGETEQSETESSEEGEGEG